METLSGSANKLLQAMKVTLEQFGGLLGLTLSSVKMEY